MIVELDCGNSLIKWRVVDEAITVVDSGVAESVEELISTLEKVQGTHRICHCRLVSVWADGETLRLRGLLERHFGFAPKCAEPLQALSGVKNGYSKFAALGGDRWAAILGAYSIARKACLVLDLGTAVTSDLIAVNGEHLGGYICPGLPLLRGQLQSHTRRIRYDESKAGAALGDMSPGCSTVEAVERGCLLMLQGFVSTQAVLAAEFLGEDFEVFVAGGDAMLVQSVLPQARFVPDLIFTGLAIACPISSEC